MNSRLAEAHLHLQDLLQPLHDDQRGFLDCRVTVLSTVLDDLHQSLVGSRAQVVLVTIGPAHKRIISTRLHPSQQQASHFDSKALKLFYVLQSIVSDFSTKTTWTTDVPSLPVCGLQQLLDNDLKGRGQAVGAGLLLVLCSICGLIRCFGQRGEGLKEKQRPGFRLCFCWRWTATSLHAGKKTLQSCFSSHWDMSGHFYNFYNNKSSSLIDQTLELQPGSPGAHFFILICLLFYMYKVFLFTI